MLRTTLRLLVLLLMLGGFARSEETLSDEIKQTDMTSADSVYELAEWCAANNKLSNAHKYYLKAISIDKDHEGARMRLGQVKVNGRWVSAALVAQRAGGGNADGSGGQDDYLKGPAAPGPSAKNVGWDLTLPPVSGDNPFVDGQIERMNNAKSDSDDMDSAILTLLRADCRPFLLRHLCQALQRPDFKGIYGASQIMKGLIDQGKKSLARTILPFVVVCSEHVSDADALDALCYIGPLLHDRRLVPRLIEMLDSTIGDVKENAADALAALTMMPAKQMTPARAKAWWDHNWNIPEKQVFAQQLHSKDLSIAIAAAGALYDLRDTDIVPVVIAALKAPEPAIDNQAISILMKITGTDWGYNSDLKPEEKAKIALNAEKWWKENKDKFKWMEDQQAATAAGPAKPVDPIAELVHQLSSVEGTKADNAAASLAGKGNAAVPALIVGLQDGSALVRLKCNDLLKDLSKQDMHFNAHGDEGELAKGVTAWRAWATSQKIELPPDPDDAGTDTDPTNKPATGDKGSKGSKGK